MFRNSIYYIKEWLSALSIPYYFIQYDAEKCFITGYYYLSSIKFKTYLIEKDILNLIAHDGRSNWFEGVMLTAVYIIIAMGFYFIGWW